MLVKSYLCCAYFLLKREINSLRNDYQTRLPMATQRLCRRMGIRKSKTTPGRYFGITCLPHVRLGVSKIHVHETKFRCIIRRRARNGRFMVPDLIQ